MLCWSSYGFLSFFFLLIRRPPISTLFPYTTSSDLCVPNTPLPLPPVKGSAFNPDPVTHIDQTVLRYLPFFPLPNAGVIGNGDTGLFTFDRHQIVSENYFTTRVDEKISEKDGLFGTYSFDNSPLTQPN